MSDTPMYKKLSRVINGALVGALTAVVLLMAVVILPGLIGFKPVVVLSGSMEPALHVGDVAVLRPVDSDRLKVGDVITYRSAGHLTTHRIIRIEEGQSGLAFYTKGDANETADGAPVHGDSAAVRGHTKVDLDWNDNGESDLAGYNMYRSTTQGGPYTKVNGSLVTVSDYADTGLTNGTTYYYVVTAEDSGTNEKRLL